MKMSVCLSLLNKSIYIMSWESFSKLFILMVFELN